MTTIKRFVSKTSLIIGLSVFGIIAFDSCNTARKHDETTVDPEVVVETDPKLQQAKTKFFFQSLPSPLHIANIFKRSGVRYEPGITHDPDKANIYQTKSSQALNLGVYSADMAYFVINDQSQPTINSLKAAQKLSDKLELQSVFDTKNLIERFEKNIGNRDSLLEFLADIAVESDMLLKKAEKFDVVFLTFAGAWTESMYIASTIAERNNNKGIIKRLVSQQQSLKNLLELLDEYKDQPDFPELISHLSGIHQVLEAVQKRMLEKADDSGPTEEEFKDLINKISDLRGKIISMQ